MNTGRWAKAPGWFKTIVWALVGVMAVASVTEGFFRLAYTPPLGMAKLWFYEYLNLERWEYLEEHRDTLLLDEEREERAPQRQPNQDFWEEAEHDRPPYDRTPGRYRVFTNSYAFRDTPFRKKKPNHIKRILFLGDSVTYGRALNAEERFSDRLRLKTPEGIEILNGGDLGCSVECEAKVLDELLELSPDLVVIQASANDVDQSLWRQAAEKIDPNSFQFKMQKWLSYSRAFLAFVYWTSSTRRGNDYADAVDAVAEYYAKSIKHIFETVKKRGIHAVVLSIPSADGTRYAEHLTQACEKYPTACLGTLEVDLDSPDKWLDKGASRKELNNEPIWITETSDWMSLDVDILVRIFPYRRYFLDQIHPNATLNHLAANQLAAFFAKHWSQWSAQK